MSVRRVIALSIAVSLAWCAAPRADEGMWTPNHLEKCPVGAWKARGLELSPADIYSPDHASLADAIVQIGGGTGSFVSADGLIITNHHVAYRAIQRNSDADNDILEQGFDAGSRENEIPAPGFEAKVLLSIKDVTKEVTKGFKEGMSGAERYRAMEQAEKRIVERAEKGRDVYCQVEPFYGGSEFRLYTYFRIKDIRLVHAPPTAIGVYGGEVDNWMWPRHTGDFAFVRAYVAPDGSSAEYAKDNVPYHPKRHLAISSAPMSEGEFVMVLGYPYTTRRYRSSHAIDFFVNHYYPRRIEYFGDVLAIIGEESKRGRDVEIKLAGTERGVANSFKNYQGMLDGLRRADLLGQKVAEEAAMERYVAEHPDLQAEYGSVIDDIGAQFDDYLTYWEPRTLLGSFRYDSQAFQAAWKIYQWAAEHEKKDIDRESGYQDRDERRQRRSLQELDANYDEHADRRIFAYFVGQLADAGFEPFAGGGDGMVAVGSDEDIAALVDRLYGGTRVTDPTARLEMFGKTRRELRAMNDPMIEFVAAIYDDAEALEHRYEAFSGALQDLRPRLIRLRAKMSGGVMYSDANGTMRLTVGEVKGYSPRDAVWYDFQTTLTGVMEKDTGVAPFNAPPKLAELYKAHDFGPWADAKADDVPVCFLSTNDITGGNSGSPVLNGRGELVGLIFDGNYESISADYQFIPRLTRAISVDSRYILFLLDRFAHARALLDELGVSGGGASG